MEKQVTDARILVLDDERNIVTVLKAILEKRGFVAEGFTSARDAIDALRKNKFDAAITDLYMPDIDGMAFLEEVKRLYPGLPVVMITAFGTVDSAVDAIKKGAFDYVTKPFEQSEIISVLQKAINTSRLNRLEMDRADSVFENSPLLRGKSAAFQKLQSTLEKIGKAPSTILITGETGSGKEFLAEAIHQRSDRAFQSMIKINCAAVSSMSLETELFGGNKPGRLELADKGTLFIDEINELGIENQIKLLEFLESGSFENPITGEKKKADVRLIAGTHKDLQREVKEGKFRDDLFYKLNIVPISLPALRDRKEDIPDIVEFFIQRLNKKLNKNCQGAERACIEVFSAVSWPGNLRQLEHTLERMMVLSDSSELRAKDIPSDLRSEMDLSSSHESTSFRDIVRKQTQNLEKDLIAKALEEMDGNITKTAEHLGISRKGLQLKLKELGIK